MRSVRETLGSTSDYLTAYANARACAPLRLLLDARASVSDEAARDAALADAVGGVSLEAIAPVAMASDALRTALNRIDALESQPAPAAARRAGRGLEEVVGLPDPVRAAAVSALEAGAGWKFAGAGIRVLTLAEQGRCKAELLRIEPGAAPPAHGHRGDEITLVLSGAFRVDGTRFAPGDLCFAKPGVEHRPMADAGEVCIALAVTDAPLQFKGLLGLLQRAFRPH